MRALLNEMVEALILDALERGATPSEAARAGGVAPKTLRTWCQRGRDADARARDGATLSTADERIRAFAARVDRATMLARLRAVDRVHKALGHEEVCMSPWAVLTVDGQPYHPILDEVGATIGEATVRVNCVHKVVVADWKAGAWYLERIDPETWGRANRNANDQPDEPSDESYDDTEVVRKVETLLAELFPSHHVPGSLTDGE